MNRKYICIGGWVTSIRDGDRHYIPAHMVARLYHVPEHECLFIDARDPDKVRTFPIEHLESEIEHLESECKLLGVDTTGMRVLRPQPNGNYTRLN